MRSTLLGRATPLLVLAACLPVAACNLITGADNLELFADNSGGDGQGGNGPSGPSSGPTTGPGGGVGSSGGGATTSSTTGPTETFEDAQGVTINEIAIYQGVKRPIMAGGQPVSSTVPVVAEREGLLRAFVTTDGNYDGQPVIARLYLNGSDTPVEQTVTINGSPSESQLGSTLNFHLAGGDIPVGFSFRLELGRNLTSALAPNPGASYPGEGFAQTDAKGNGGTLRITLVPVQYGADGSNRLPDLSAGQLAAYHDLFYGMYPAGEVEITVRDAVPWNSNVASNGSGWENLLSYIGQVRADDNAPFDAYYYGIFSPSSSVNNYCGGGCVAGLGNIGGPNDAYSRAAIGLGFSGTIATETAVHEIGHTHGRYHAPCGGAAGTDPNFPYSGAKLGAWGYDVVTQTLFSPSNTVDLMSYCTPIWVSDYQFTALFNRIKAVNGASIFVPDELKNLTYDRARIDGEGQLHWLSPVTLEMPPSADPVDLTVESDAGTSLVTGQFYPYDHLPGGVVLWPQAGGPTKSLVVDLAGTIGTLEAE
jgi:hypothetical protein